MNNLVESNKIINITDITINILEQTKREFTEIDKIRKYVVKIQEENKQLKNINSNLYSEINILQGDLKALQKNNKKLNDENREIIQENKKHKTTPWMIIHDVTFYE
jgi:predicted nuclease with TOPRIM domain